VDNSPLHKEKGKYTPGQRQAKPSQGNAVGKFKTINLDDNSDSEN
jgi:hypothetical protein